MASQSLEQQRRSIGQAMVTRRTGSAQVNDINSVVTKKRAAKLLKALEAKGKIDEKTGVAEYNTGRPTAGTGGGIASPLTEKTKVVEGKTVPDRDYYAAGFTSSDGLFVLPATKTMRMTDANGDEVVIALADPQGAT